MIKQGLSKSISRRDLFKGIGIGAVAAAVPGLSQPASAQVSPPPSPSIGFKRFRVGDFELTVIQDGNVVFDPFALAVDQAEGTVEAALTEHNLPRDGITTGAHPFLINTGDRLVLIDTGSGTGMGAPSSGLLDTLAVLGIAPESIDTVIISHWHPDHIGANIVDGEAAFPNAQYYFPEVEWEFARAVPEDSPAAAFVPAFEAQVMPLEAEGRLTFYGDSDELVTGIQATLAAGHTPGQHIFEIASNGHSLLATKDVAVNYLLGLRHPEWVFFGDADPQIAAQTRRNVFGRAADEGLMVLAYHFPFPGVGYVVRDEEGFRFLPVAV